MNDFRAFVEEEEVMAMEPMDHNYIEGGSKEKIDIEMGTIFGESNGQGLPDILRNLRYDDIEDSMKHRDESERTDSDQFIVQIEQELKESMNGLTIEEVEANIGEKHDIVSAQHTTSSPA